MDVAQWLEALSFTDDELVAVCHKHSATSEFKYSVLPKAAVPQYVELMSAEHDVWLGVNPVAGPVRSTGGRGKPEDVTRMSAVFADLDVKPGGCEDYDVAQAIVDELAELLGEYPTMVVFSGHGLQPYWALDPEALLPSADVAQVQWQSVLARFGRLVRAVANAHGAKVDSVFDLARILRAPGTRNFKGDVPADASGVLGSGAPMDLATLDERLAEAGIFDEPISSPADDANESDPSGWQWAEQACGYVSQMARQWMTEPVDGRHPWALRCMTRLECARRNGCLTRELYQGISEMVQQRFSNLLASQQPSRRPYRYEWRDICQFAERLAATKGTADLASELGGHPHESLIDAAVKAGNVRALPTSRNAGKSPAAGSSAPGIATVTPLPTAQPQPQNYTMTDDGNALRLVAEHADRLRYLPGDRLWLSWTGTRWLAADDDSPAKQAARAMVRNLPVIPGDKQAAGWKKSSLSGSRVKAMIELARSDPRMQVRREDLDARPYELNTPSGIVDLRTGALLPHDPARWHTKITGVPYLPDATAPLWAAFLDTTFQGQQDMVRYVQQLSGYSCLGEVADHVMPFLHGVMGQNGKSVLLRVFQECLGDYATTLPVAALVAGRQEHTEDIAALHGTRLAVCSEVGHDTRWDEEKIKNLTGGDTISARHLYGKPFNFRPTHTIMIAANDAPGVEAGGKSFFRRFKVVPFTHSMPDDKVDVRLPFKLIEQEGAAILAWMIRGTVDYLENDLIEPDLVTTATAEYQESEDVVLQWLRQACDTTVGEDEGGLATDLFIVFREWCARNRIYAQKMSVKDFGIALTRHKIGKKPHRRGSYRTGIKPLHAPEATGVEQFLRGPGPRW